MPARDYVDFEAVTPPRGLIWFDADWDDQALMEDLAASGCPNPDMRLADLKRDGISRFYDGSRVIEVWLG